ncbi:MAG: sugar ABC transporter permease, partial [Chloroflexota bacterium]
EFLSPDTALTALIVVNAWKSYPFYMIAILGGLQSIPQDMYEAAKVDGASALGRFRYVTLPMIRQVLIVISTIDLIASMGAMELVNILTQGGPMRTTETMAYYIYMWGIQDGNLGYGAAASTLTLAIMLILAIVYLRILSRGGESGETNF